MGNNYNRPYVSNQNDNYNNNQRNSGYDDRSAFGGKSQYSYRGNGGNNGSSNRKKHSGAKMRTSKTGNPTIFGWNYSRRLGMVKLSASPWLANAKDREKYGLSIGETVDFTSKSGKVYRRYLCRIEVPFQEVRLTTGLYEIASGKLRLPDMGLVASTNAPNGGYFGKAGKPSPNKR